MGRAKIDYPKAYRELKAQVQESNARYAKLLVDYSNLKTEYNKAVEKGKENVELLYEQRGVIGFLETKIVKLTELLEQKHKGQK